MKKTALLVILCLSAHSISASNISIRGTIYSDIDSLPAISAQVDLFNADSALIQTTRSFADGAFELSRVQLSNNNGFLRISMHNHGNLYIPVVGEPETIIDIGKVYLNFVPIDLDEVSVIASNIIEQVDRMIVFPTSQQIRASQGSMELLDNLHLPNLRVDIINQRISIDGRIPIFMINGRPVSREQILGLDPTDIVRIEYSDTSPIRFMDLGAGGVINFILRERLTGGSFFTNVRGAPFVGFLNGTASTTFNYRRSEFGILYNNSWRDYTKRIVNQEELFISDNEIFSRTTTGRHSPFGYLDQNLSFTYTYQHNPGTMLSIIFGNSFGRQHDESRSDISEQWQNFNTEFFRQTNAYFNAYIPSLDIFFLKQFENNQSVEFNVVGTTLLNSTSERRLYDDGKLLVDDRVEGQRRSLILEGIYSKRFENISLRTGVRHIGSYTRNDYMSLNAATNIIEMTTHNSHLFAQLAGRVSRLTYDVGTGVRVQQVNNRVDSRTFTKANVTANLMHPITRHIRVSYRFDLDPRLPTLFQLSDVEQHFEEIAILKGNPNLESFYSVRNRILFTYSRDKIRANWWLSHNRANNPIVTYTYYDSNRGLFVSEFQNQIYNESFNTQLDLTVNSLFNFLTFTVTGGWNRFRTLGHEYRHLLDNFYWEALLNASIIATTKRTEFLFQATIF